MFSGEREKKIAFVQIAYSFHFISSACCWPVYWFLLLFLDGKDKSQNITWMLCRMKVCMQRSESKTLACVCKLIKPVQNAALGEINTGSWYIYMSHLHRVKSNYSCARSYSVRFDNTGGRASHFRKDHVTCTEFATVELYQHASEQYKESLEINSYKHDHTLGYNAIACSASCYTNSGLHIGTTANSSVIQMSSWSWSTGCKLSTLMN